MGKKDRCCVQKCGHDRDEGATCSFFSVPLKPLEVVAKYQALLKYDVVDLETGKKTPWYPTSNTRICSCHWPPEQSPGKYS